MPFWVRFASVGEGGEISEGDVVEEASESAGGGGGGGGRELSSVTFVAASFGMHVVSADSRLKFSLFLFTFVGLCDAVVAPAVSTGHGSSAESCGGI